jgi:hypothetical protein
MKGATAVPCVATKRTLRSTSTITIGRSQNFFRAARNFIKEARILNLFINKKIKRVALKILS